MRILSGLASLVYMCFSHEWQEIGKKRLSHSIVFHSVNLVGARQQLVRDQKVAGSNSFTQTTKDSRRIDRSGLSSLPKTHFAIRIDVCLFALTLLIQLVQKYVKDLVIVV